MDSEIRVLKDRIDQLRSEKGKRAKIPDDIWSGIAQLAQSRTLKEVCSKVGVCASGARKKIKKPSGAIPQGFIQLPNSSHPVLELTLKSGSVIKVFEQ